MEISYSSRSKNVCKVKLLNFQVRMELIYEIENWSNNFNREILHQKQPHSIMFRKSYWFSSDLQHSDKFYRTFSLFNLATTSLRSDPPASKPKTGREILENYFQFGGKSSFRQLQNLALPRDPINSSRHSSPGAVTNSLVAAIRRTESGGRCTTI